MDDAEGKMESIVETGLAPSPLRLGDVAAGGDAARRVSTNGRGTNATGSSCGLFAGEDSVDLAQFLLRE
jgi:hypothetical protein